MRKLCMLWWPHQGNVRMWNVKQWHNWYIYIYILIQKENKLTDISTVRLGSVLVTDSYGERWEGGHGLCLLSCSSSSFDDDEEEELSELWGESWSLPESSSSPESEQASSSSWLFSSCSDGTLHRNKAKTLMSYIRCVSVGTKACTHSNSPELGLMWPLESNFQQLSHSYSGRKSSPTITFLCMCMIWRDPLTSLQPLLDKRNELFGFWIIWFIDQNWKNRA